VQTVQRKALRYIKDWTKQFEESGDPNLGLMTELYDQLREKSELATSSSMLMLTCRLYIRRQRACSRRHGGR
jgi:signal transducing adaptor molecule